MFMIRFWGLVCLLATPLLLSAQDPFFLHFYGNESSFNPAFVGKRGALSVAAKYKSQWGASTARPYRTVQVTVEESIPCFFLDWGLTATRDEEGEGLLTTNEFGLRGAFFIPTGSARRRAYQGVGNIRVGIGLHWGQRSIDFNRLSFLDQLDPLYGLFNRDGVANVSDFRPGENPLSPWYFTPSFGVAWRQIFNRHSEKSWVLDLGFAVHNWSGLIPPDSRQTASLLGLDNPLGERWIISAVGEKVVYSRKRRYWSIRPQVLVQWQDGLGYAEVGAAVIWNRALTAGAYFHAARNEDFGPNSNWLSLQLELGQIIPNSWTRLDLGINYSIPSGPLKNYVFAPLELSATLHFGTSPSCHLTGRGGEIPYGEQGTSCYLFNYSAGRRKLYDNIWYSDRQF